MLNQIAGGSIINFSGISGIKQPTVKLAIGPLINILVSSCEGNSKTGILLNDQTVIFQSTKSGNIWRPLRPVMATNSARCSSQVPLTCAGALALNTHEFSVNSVAFSTGNLNAEPKTKEWSKWVCLKIGYIPNYSHLIGIMIINHWV